LLSVTATKVARVFSFIPPKEAPQPLDANLDQRLIRVELLGLILDCQHTSMWRDMTQQRVRFTINIEMSKGSVSSFSQVLLVATATPRHYGSEEIRRRLSAVGLARNAVGVHIRRRLPSA
jgi:hypothetical protein